MSNQVVVSKVVDGSPASSAGILEGDVLVRIHSQLISTSNDASSAMERFSKLNADVVFVVRRDGASVNFDLPLSSSLESFGLFLVDEDVSSGDSVNTHSFALGILGVISLVAGLVFLVFNPLGAAHGSADIINLQGMFIGTSLSIVGAIFVAAEWRPR